MIKRDSCYFCTSTFQLFAIISLALSRNESADLYIDPQFTGADVFAKRIRDKKIFENVVVIGSERIYKKYMTAGPGLRNHLQIANTYLHVGDIAKSILLDNVQYSNMFLSSKAYLPRMVQLYYIKQKVDFQTFYFDDGAGSYENNRAYRISKSDEFLRLLLFGRRATKTNYIKYLFSPEIYFELNSGSENAYSIMRAWDNQYGEDLFNEIFGIIKKPEIRERVVILDQPKEEIFSSSGIRTVDTIYSELVQSFGYENVIVKKHPRSSDKDFQNIKYFQSQGLPFELYCMNIDMNEKIIVAHSSTAVATPKILFDQEPIIIVLSKIIEPITGEKNLFVNYFEAVKKTYRNKDKVIIPNNMDELFRTLESRGLKELYD